MQRQISTELGQERPLIIVCLKIICFDHHFPIRITEKYNMLGETSLHRWHPRHLPWQHPFWHGAIIDKNLRNELFDTQVAWVKEKVTFLALSLIFQLVTAVGAAVTIILADH